MNKQRLIVIAAVLVVVAVAGIMLYRRDRSSEAPIGDELSAEPTPPPPATATREPAPANISIPTKGATDMPANVAAPSIVAAANASGSAFRSFEIKVEGGHFTPDTVIVRQGDTVHIDVTGVDRAYDFTQPDYGFKTLLLKGQSKQIEFNASASGKFKFYCAACGGPDKGPVGYIIISPK